MADDMTEPGEDKITLHGMERTEDGGMLIVTDRGVEKFAVAEIMDLLVEAFSPVAMAGALLATDTPPRAALTAWGLVLLRETARRQREKMEP